MMDKSEPTLVPQWLRSNGSVSGNGTSINHFQSSSLRSDDSGTPKVVRKNSSSSHDQNLWQSSASERIKSSYFRRSFSNNGNKEGTVLGDFKRRDLSDSFGIERKSLRRSHSGISDQRDETWRRDGQAGSKSGYKISNNNANRAPDNSSPHKASFEQDFPSLGLEEKLAASEIRRVPSPGLSPAIRTFPVAASSMIGTDKWTSALAEVPCLEKTNETGISAKAYAPGSPTTAASISNGLSMAETVAQGPPRVKATPQLSAESQRQELAIKQSRQLIPVTPLAPKALVPNLPEKTKAKIGQPHLIHSPRCGSPKPDNAKTTNIGKLQVLKPVRERNGASLPELDALSPKSDTKAVSSVLVPTHSVTESSSVRAQVNNSGHLAAERKRVLPLLETRPTSQSQTKSRNDFFSLMRKKSISHSSPAPGSVPVMSASDKKLGQGEDSASPVTDQSGEIGAFSNIPIMKSFENINAKVSGGDPCNGGESLNNRKNGSTCNSSVFSEEEEASFLRSLGWEENTEEGGLTDEEINAFYKDVTKYINSKPSWKILQGMPRFLLALDSQIGSVAGFSPGMNSSSKLES